MKFSPKMIATAMAVTMAAGAGLIGTAQASATPTAPTAVVQKTAPAAEDGRALFAGLLFTQGPVADSLIDAGYFHGTEAMLEANRDAEAVAEVAALSDAIEASDPRFFARLSKDLRSGNPRRVEAGMQNAAEALQSHADLITEDGDSFSGTCVAALVAVNVVAVANYAVAFNAEVAYDVQHFWGQSPELPREDSIGQLSTLLRTL